MLLRLLFGNTLITFKTIACKALLSQNPWDRIPAISAIWLKATMRLDENIRSQQILKAAEVCILRQGLNRASMEVIAAQAGLSRRTLYRVFPTRELLLAELFKAHSLDAKFFAAKERVSGLAFEDALFEATKVAIRLIREDSLMMEMIYRSGALWFQKQMLDNQSPFFRAVVSVQLQFWGDLLDQARAEGKINPEVTNEQLLEWHALVQFMMVFRVNGDEREQEFLLKNFLIPSLVSNRQAKPLQ